MGVHCSLVIVPMPVGYVDVCVGGLFSLQVTVIRDQLIGSRLLRLEVGLSRFSAHSG